MALDKEQRKLRRTGVAASEIAAICGLSHWAGPGDVWAEKMGMRDEDPVEENEDIERGNELEEALVKWTGRRLSLPAHHNKTTFRSEKEPLALATPDGLLFDMRDLANPSATIEVKAPSWKTAKEWSDPADSPDGCPKHYLVQSQWQAGVLGLSEAVVSGFVDGRLWIYRLPFSEEIYAALLRKAKEFWSYVERREPPPFDPGLPAEWVSAVYREQKSQDVVKVEDQRVLSDIIHAAETYAASREIASRARLDMDAAKGYLCSLIEGRQGIQIPGYRCTWKQGKGRTDVDWEKVARRAMDRLACICDVVEMDAWIAEFSAFKPGSRTFTLKKEGES
jgi:putative phage-type endonuclease